MAPSPAAAPASSAGWCRPPDTLSGAHRAFVFGVFPIEGRVVLGLTVDRLGFDDDTNGPGDARPGSASAARAASAP